MAIQSHTDDPSDSTPLSNQVSPIDHDEHTTSASSSPITRLAVPARTSSKQENRLPKNEDEKVPNPSERISRKGKVPWENRYENERKGSLEASLTETAKQILFANKKLKRQVSMDETY
jgi:hypothetical protein